MDDQSETGEEYAVFIGNLKKDASKTDLKRKLFDLFKHHLKIGLKFHDIKLKGRKNKPKYAFIHLQSKIDRDMALNLLGSWESRSQLSFGFLHIVEPNQIIKVCVKKPDVVSKAGMKSDSNQEIYHEQYKNSDTKTKMENTHSQHKQGVILASHISEDSENVPIKAGWARKSKTVHFSSNEIVDGRQGSTKHYEEGETLGNETRDKEFKAGGGDHYINKNLKDHVSKYLCGFLNSSQRGTLYIGVKDNGTVVGIECDQHTEDNIRIKIDQTVKTIKPAIFPQNYHVDFIPIYHTGGALKYNHKVLEITVEKVETLTQLYEAAGEVYIRRDGSVQGPLKPSDIQEWSKQIHHKELQKALKRQEDKNNKILELEKQKIVLDMEEEKKRLQNESEQEISHLQKQISEVKEENKYLKKHKSKVCVVM
ncbi:uncharacterized protein [Mytilus edulis]|uniref:uncharacterized protein n=1 Tax=Mytilus edulis TaxID=6550 RepID=UPI0039EFE81A